MKFIGISLHQLLLGGALVVATGFTIPALAQGPSSGGTAPGAIPSSTPSAVPLDGGASLLLAGGAAYGLRKLRQRYGRK